MPPTGTRDEPFMGGVAVTDYGMTQPKTWLDMRGLTFFVYYWRCDLRLGWITIRTGWKTLVSVGWDTTKHSHDFIDGERGIKEYSYQQLLQKERTINTITIGNISDDYLRIYDILD